MSQILRVPDGLQSLLGSQNFGVNPSQLAPVTQPTLDLAKFFGKTLLRRGFVAINASVINAAATMTVPEGEMWEPLQQCVFFVNNNAAGARARAYGKMAVPDEAGASGLVEWHICEVKAPTILDALSTSVGYGAQANYPAGVLVGPGSQFSAQVTDLDLNGGTSVNMGTILLYRRYTV